MVGEEVDTTEVPLVLLSREAGFLRLRVWRNLDQAEVLEMMMKRLWRVQRSDRYL